MNTEIIRVEPLSTYLENWKAPTSAVTRCGDTIYVSGFPPFDPDTGKVIEAPIERQTELVLEQMKLCLETVGSSLANVLPKDPPARIFVCVPAWPGPFDIEIDCVATLERVAVWQSADRWFTSGLPSASSPRLSAARTKSRAARLARRTRLGPAGGDSPSGRDPAHQRPNGRISSGSPCSCSK